MKSVTSLVGWRWGSGYGNPSWVAGRTASAFLKLLNQDVLVCSHTASSGMRAPNYEQHTATNAPVERTLSPNAAHASTYPIQL
jgi:hypothetical protein